VTKLGNLSVANFVISCLYENCSEAFEEAYNNDDKSSSN